MSEHPRYPVYRETPPPPALADTVQCGWECRGNGVEKRVLPDGCIDIVVEMRAMRVATPTT